MLLSDPFELAFITRGKWQNLQIKNNLKISNIAYLQKNAHPNSLGLLTNMSANFGFAPETLPKYDGIFSALMGTQECAPNSKIPYLRVDGVAKAFKRIAEYQRRNFKGKIVGVTGSAGKSSFCSMLNTILSSRYGEQSIAQTEQNENLQLGIMRALSMLSGDEKFAVLEVAAGHAQICSEISRPDVAVLTNLSLAHAELFGGLEQIADKKLGLFSHMNPDGVAVLCRQMALYDYVKSKIEAKGFRIVTYGISEDCDVQLRAFDNASGIVSSCVFGVDASYILPGANQHFALNTCGVIAAIQALGVSWQDSIASLRKWHPLPGRGTVFALSHNIYSNIQVIDESFNAAPIAMKAALKALSDRGALGRRIAVLGEMRELGESALDIHNSLSSFVKSHAKSIDQFFVIGEMYREFYNSLEEEARGGFFVNWESAFDALKSSLLDNDTILVKGAHGSKVYRIVEQLKLIGD
jgi:UDP-N-acetylmuramoyl-tripeptide--D-alanyl-D-alanine ligase